MQSMGRQAALSRTEYEKGRVKKSRDLYLLVLVVATIAKHDHKRHNCSKVCRNVEAQNHILHVWRPLLGGPAIGRVAGTALLVLRKLRIPQQQRSERQSNFN